MHVPAEFDDIRCYYDEEIHPALEEVLQVPQIAVVLAGVVGADMAEYMLRVLHRVHSIEDFQREVIIILLTALERKTCTDVCLQGIEHADKENGNFYISNHRDIVLDSALLNSHLYFKGHHTTQIAIGNNLLIYPWIQQVVRMNKSFVVKRDGSVRQQLEISRHLSSYIRYVRTHNKDSIWMAQREGRAKNSDDRTQSALLKMLTLSGEGSVCQRLQALRLTPVAFNYEYDPCDWLKAQEFQQKRDDAGYKKTPADDLLNMQTGLSGFKGRVQINIAEPLRFDPAWETLQRNEQANTVAAAIDKQIHLHYHLFPNNYVAADLLQHSDNFAAHYTAQDKQGFLHYIQGRLSKITLPGKDEEFLRSKLYEMYANPALNQAAALSR